MNFQTRQAEKIEALEAPSQLCRDEALRLSSCIDSIQISAGELLNLTVGDIIETHKKLNEAFTVNVGDKVAFNAYLAKSGHKKVLVVSD